MNKLLIIFIGMASFQLFSTNSEASLNLDGKKIKLAKSPELCTEIIKNFPAFRAHRFWSNTNKKCWLSISPMDNNDFVYRSYVMNSDGTFLVFNSIDKETYGVSDGARSFMFFPRNAMPSVENLDESLMAQTSNQKMRIHFSHKENAILAFDGANFQLDPKIHPYNNGGLEIQANQTIVLDGGWRNYGDPFAIADRSSYFIDPMQNICEVKNSEIFEYKSDTNKVFKFNDTQLYDFLQKRCLHLNLQSLITN